MTDTKTLLSAILFAPLLSLGACQQSTEPPGDPSSDDPAATRPALIVQPRARRALTALLRLRAPQCLVLSINELPAAQPIEVIAVVGDETPEQPAQLGHETEALAA